MKKRNQERDYEIGRLYINGQTLQAIGDQFGLAKERVRQILRTLEVYKGDRFMESSGRDQFLGINITESCKKALKEEADRRGVSMSALSSDTLSEMLTACGYPVEAEEVLKAKAE